MINYLEKVEKTLFMDDQVMILLMEVQELILFLLNSMTLISETQTQIIQLIFELQWPKILEMVVIL